MGLPFFLRRQKKKRKGVRVAFRNCAAEEALAAAVPDPTAHCKFMELLAHACLSKFLGVARSVR